MSLFMTLLVRDEADIVDANIRYHLDQGVDHIVAMDNLSVDGTTDILEGYARAGALTLIRQTGDNFAQAKWVTEMAGLACSRGADWILHSDADEFWIARGGTTLAGWFATERRFTCVQGQRHDFIALEGMVERPLHHMIWRKTVSLNPLGGPLPPKVAHRAQPGLSIRAGNHDVDGLRPKIVQANALDILHFPLRSRAQYLRKIEHGGRAYARNTELLRAVGSTWRRQWDELQRTGRLAFVEDNIVAEDRLAALIAAGEVMEDRRLLEALDRIG